jgi:glycosyltransferase involved in cell wall biosynthesis
MKLDLKPLSNPILFVGDNPALHGGLSRIGRDLATLAATMPEFRVGYLGRGMGNTRKLPFTLYAYPEYLEWGQTILEEVWNDFSGGEAGVVMTLDDPSRRYWFAQGDNTKFLGPGRNFKKWGYFPIDSVGFGGFSLPIMGRLTLQGYDRVLAASEWGRNVASTDSVKADWLPHGIFGKFRPCVSDPKCNLITIGCVMANQQRKDFPAAFECFWDLKQKWGNNFQAWLHVDVVKRYWDVANLILDYGVGDCIEVTTSLTDDELAVRYSSCHCTILPSAGEGFGYPIAESMACGTPCIVTGYGAGKELVANDCVAPIKALKMETIHNVLRAVVDGGDFAQLAAWRAQEKKDDWEGVTKRVSDSVRHLRWEHLKTPWEKWFREGLCR